jgi:hypothetical protein
VSDRVNQIRTALAAGPVPAGSLRAGLDVTRPTLARALAEMPGEIVTLGSARATRYALRDKFRGLSDMPVYRVNSAGQIQHLGQLIPVRSDGFVMVPTTGATVYHEGLPWWVTDMRPQGFLGRAYARQCSTGLGLPPDVRHWSDTDALRALLSNGGDAVGNLLLGDLARDRFVNSPLPTAVGASDYPRLAAEALTSGETWSSAGGEQPKFCAYTDRGHVLVKFTAQDDNPVTARWRDLLLAEHLALETLQAGGVSAAQSRVVDIGAQRFLELERFDRVGPHGRHALLSLASLDGEFVGNATAPWPGGGHAGRAHARWDEGAAATPHGQLVFFAEFLAATGVFERWVSSCPLDYRSGNAPDKRDVLGTLMLGCWPATGATRTSPRCAATRWLRRRWAWPGRQRGRAAPGAGAHRRGQPARRGCARA